MSKIQLFLVIGFFILYGITIIFIKPFENKLFNYILVISDLLIIVQLVLMIKIQLFNEKYLFSNDS